MKWIQTTGVISIIRLGAKIDSKDPVTWKTALHIASEERIAEICRFLVLSKANVMEKDRLGNSPLHICCQKGSLECLRAILQAYAGKTEAVKKKKKDKYDQQVSVLQEE